MKKKWNTPLVLVKLTHLMIIIETFIPKLREGFFIFLSIRTGPVRKSKKGGWTSEEDELLTKAVERYNGKNWKKIAESIKGRTGVQCLHRWQKVLNPNLVKGPWTKEEDGNNFV